MKILVVTSIFRPFRKGGTEVVAEMVIDALAKEYAVTVVTIDRSAPRFSLRPFVLEEGGVRVIRIAPWNIFSYLDIDRYPFWKRVIWHIIDCVQLHGFFLLWNSIGYEKPDVVCTHAIKGIGYLSFFAIRMRGIPHVHTMHDIQFTYPNGLLLVGQEKSALQPSRLLCVYAWYTRFVLGSPVAVVFPSRFLRDWYVSRGFFKRSRIEVMANPFPGVSVAAPMDTALKMLHTPLRILCIGQLEPHKGVRFLVEALEYSPVPCEIWFAGSGSLSGWLEEKAQALPWIRILGVIKGEEKDRAFREVDYTAITSLCYENSPTVINESLGLGTPLIVARIGGVAESIIEGENGYVFEPGDTGSFVAALEKAYNNKQYGVMSAKAMYDAQRYSLESYIHSLAILFSAVCPKK